MTDSLKLNTQGSFISAVVAYIERARLAVLHLLVIICHCQPFADVAVVNAVLVRKRERTTEAQWMTLSAACLT